MSLYGTPKSLQHASEQVIEGLAQYYNNLPFEVRESTLQDDTLSALIQHDEEEAKRLIKVHQRLYPHYRGERER